MIQFNLLPDVKKEYVKTKRTKRMITTVSLFSSIAAIVIVAIMFSIVNIAQKKHINDIKKDIESITSEIQSTENLDQILTVQNQLSLLGGLHESKPEASRVFNYVKFVTPETAKVSSMDLDLLSYSMILSGSADSIATINKFVDNLKAVRYVTTDYPDELKQPYTQVTTSLSGDNETASFRVTLAFDPVIFSNTQEIVMRIGSQQVSTVIVEEQ